MTMRQMRGVTPVHGPHPVRPPDPVRPADPSAPARPQRFAPGLRPRVPGASDATAGALMAPTDPETPAYLRGPVLSSPPAGVQPAGRTGRLKRAVISQNAPPHTIKRPQARSSSGGRSSRMPWILGLLAAVLLFASNHGHSSSTVPVTHNAAPAAVESQGVRLTRSGLAVSPAILPAHHALDASLAGVSLPGTGTGNRLLPPVRLVLALPAAPSPRERADLTALAGWMQGHEQVGTLVRLLIAGRPPRMTPPVSPGALVDALTAHAASWDTARRWLTSRTPPEAASPVRLAIGVGTPAPRLPFKGVKTGSVQLESGAPIPSSEVADPRRAHAITAAIALQIIDATGQREVNPPHVLP